MEAIGPGRETALRRMILGGIVAGLLLNAMYIVLAPLVTGAYAEGGYYSQASYNTPEGGSGGIYSQSSYYSQASYDTSEGAAGAPIYSQSTYYSQSSYYSEGGYYSQGSYYGQASYGPSAPMSFTFEYEPNGYCARVTVTKSDTHPRTVIHSDGYSVSCELVTTSTRVLQRSVELKY